MLDPCRRIFEQMEQLPAGARATLQRYAGARAALADASAGRHACKLTPRRCTCTGGGPEGKALVILRFRAVLA